MRSKGFDQVSGRCLVFANVTGVCAGLSTAIWAPYSFFTPILVVLAVYIGQSLRKSKLAAKLAEACVSQKERSKTSEAQNYAEKIDWYRDQAPLVSTTAFMSGFAGIACAITWIALHL